MNVLTGKRLSLSGFLDSRDFFRSTFGRSAVLLCYSLPLDVYDPEIGQLIIYHRVEKLEEFLCNLRYINAVSLIVVV